MAKVFIEETTLTNIGNAIREKEGSTDLIPVTDMSTRIANIQAGGGGIPEEAFTITGNCHYRFAYGAWSWFLENYGNQITTKDITSCERMFYENSNTQLIPFTLNIKDCENFSYMFYQNRELKVCPKIRGTIKWSTSTNFTAMVTYCPHLQTLDDLFEPEMLDGFSTVKPTSKSSLPKVTALSGCMSLRKVPEWFYKFQLNEESTVFPNYTYTPYESGFRNCYTLDEITNISVWRCAAAQTTNMFSSTFDNCHRVKEITFETQEDGTPYTVQWKAQTISLRTATPVLTSPSYFINYGLPADKEVKDDATYQALKNDPDWWTTNTAYSRYNHDSAVNTINSLPDTSAYLATAGGTNTIKFFTTGGSATDGGAINTLTEEEIAVATAKGWTVTFTT